MWRVFFPHDFGVFAVALTVYVIVSSISDVGVSSCLMRADLDIDRLAPTVATVSIFTSAMLAIAMALFATPIATALGSAAAAADPDHVDLRAAGGRFSVPNAQMTRDFKQDKVFLADAISFIPSTGLLILLAKNGSGATAFAWSRLAGQAVLGVVLIALLHRHYRARPLAERPVGGLESGYRWPAQLRELHPAQRQLRLRRPSARRGQTRRVHAGLHAGLRPIQSPGRGHNSVAMPASPGQRDPVLLRHAMATGVRTITLVALPMCALTMALSGPLVLTLYGTKWAAAGGPLAASPCTGRLSSSASCSPTC